MTDMELADQLEGMLHQVGHPDYSLKEFYEGIKLIVWELRQERPPSGEMVMVPRDTLRRIQNECRDVVSFQVAIHNLLAAAEASKEAK